MLPSIEQEEDRDFARRYTKVLSDNGLFQLSRELSTRLRQMDKRAKAANQRADEMEARWRQAERRLEEARQALTLTRGSKEALAAALGVRP